MTSKEKEKLAMWSQQKKTIYSKVKDSNPSKEEKLMAKIAEKEEAIGKSSSEIAEVRKNKKFAKTGKWHHACFQIDGLCKAMDEESLPEFFVKFGLDTGLIEDVSTFRKWMKANSYSAVTANAKSKKKKYRLVFITEKSPDLKTVKLF